MTDHDIHGCGRAGAAMGVLCAFFGAVTAGMITLASGLADVSTIPRLAPPVAIGLVGLFVGAGFFGKLAGVFLCKQGNSTAMNILVGILLAYGSIAIAFVTGILAAAVLSEREIENVMVLGYFIAIFAAIYAAVPGALLGVLYGLLMRRELRKLNY